MEHINTATGVWQGDWNADRAKFTGTYYFADGRTFVGNADWVTERVRAHINAAGKTELESIVHMPVTPHWEYTGGWFRRDGNGAAAPHMPEPPEQRDNNEPPAEQAYDKPFVLPAAPRQAKAEASAV